MLMTVETLWGVYIISFIIFALIYTIFKGRGTLDVGFFVSAILSGVLLAVLYFTSFDSSQLDESTQKSLNGLWIFAGLITIATFVWILVAMSARSKEEKEEKEEKKEQDAFDISDDFGSSDVGSYDSLDKVLERDVDGSLKIKYLA